MANLLATKPLNLLMEEARETGEHSLKRTLGVFQLTALGVGAIIGAGIFVMVGLGAHYAGPGLTLSFVLSGLGCAFAGLCYAEFAAMIPLAGSAYTYAYATLGELLAWIIGWDLTLEYAMGASTVSSGWSNHFIELLNIFHIKMPLWLAYDHWTALKTAENIVARQMAQASDSSLVPGTQAFLDKVSAIMSAQSPELLQRAHELLGAPHLFGMEIGFNLPAFLIALVITAILVVGHQRERAVQRHDRRDQSGGRAVRDRAGLSLHQHAPTGARTGTRTRPTASPESEQGAAYIFFAYIGFDAVSTTAQEAKNPQRDLPIGMIASLAICTVLYIAVAGVLTGMVHWQQINIEAPVARAFLDRGLTTASHIITLGALAGLTSVMLVMLLGQTRVLYSMANDGLLAEEVFRRCPSQVPHAVEEHDPGGPAGGDCRQRDSDRRYRQDGEHRHAAGVCDRVDFRVGVAAHQSQPAAALPHAVGAAGSDPGRDLQRLHDVQAGLGELGAADSSGW